MNAVILLLNSVLSPCLHGFPPVFFFSIDNLLYSNFSSVNENLSREFEQILAYLTYRHISRAIDNLDLMVRLSFVILSFKVINQIFAFLNKGDNTNKLENLIEACRIYSSEIECSDYNITTLLNKIESLVKFI